ncbi:MAG: hypothetical protein ACSHXB_00825 [Sulfitobacter sp.]
MSDGNTKAFEASLKESKWRFETQGLRSSDRAYEYGVLVVKNAMLVSGGGLFFIPTMASLSKNISLEWAFASGMLFGACVLLTLIANYLIHLNWLFLEGSWEEIYEIEKIQARLAYSRPFQSDEQNLILRKEKLATANRRITLSFYGPHLIALVFVIAFGFAAFCLYEAFFYTIEHTS